MGVNLGLSLGVSALGDSTLAETDLGECFESCLYEGKLTIDFLPCEEDLGIVCHAFIHAQSLNVVDVRNYAHASDKLQGTS